MSQRVKLVMAIMDHPSHLCGSAEDWLQEKKNLSFDDLTENQVKEIINELRSTK